MAGVGIRDKLPVTFSRNVSELPDPHVYTMTAAPIRCTKSAGPQLVAIPMQRYLPSQHHAGRKDFRQNWSVLILNSTATNLTCTINIDD